MKRYIAPLALSLFALLALPTAHAACGGGGYKAPVSQTTSVNSSATTTNYQPNYQPTYQSQSSSNYSTANFDASYFHRISGRLHLNYEQSTKIIASLNEIRNELATGKKFDPKQEFEARLSKILDPQQFKDFQTLKTQA